jgi:hypothetical protein
MITIVWDWVSFFVGFFAAISAAFWILVWIAFRQWRASKKIQAAREASFEDIMSNWGKDK